MVRWLGLLCATSLILACSDSETTSSSGGDGGMPIGGMGGSAEGGGGMGASGGMGGDGGMGGGGMGGGCQNVLPNEEMAPLTLSATGLYEDIATKQLAGYVQEFTPQYPLWSDGATKTRWVYLPECDSQIDNSNEDIWDFPVGTRMWKQFERDGELLETRLIHRWGPGDDDFTLVAYKWNDQDDEADLLTDGELDVKGTEHDIPSPLDCTRCHGNGILAGGIPSRYLGFSALQLSHDGAGATMATLSSDGHLTVPNATGYTAPGNATEQAALGYLHSNCGNCHNGTSDGLLYPDIRFQLSVNDTDPTQTLAYSTTVGVPPQQFTGGGCTLLVDGMDPTNSCVSVRMKGRGPDTAPGNVQMPPLGTQDPDSAGGVAAVDAWINTIP